MIYTQCSLLACSIALRTGQNRGDTLLEGVKVPVPRSVGVQRLRRLAQVTQLSDAAEKSYRNPGSKHSTPKGEKEASAPISAAKQTGRGPPRRSIYSWVCEP